MEILTFIVLWLIALFLFLIWWTLIKIRQDLQAIEHWHRITDNLMARISKKLLRPEPKVQNFPHSMEH